MWSLSDCLSNGLLPEIKLTTSISRVKSLLQTAEQKVRDDSSCMLGGFRPPGLDSNEMYGNAGYTLV